MTAQALRVAVFPGAANAPLYLALERGWFVEAGVAVDVIEVRSSDEQMRLWVGGGIGAMHTSPDHLLRERWPFDPVIVRNNGFGELSVYRRPDAAPLESVVWAVDGLDSGFAFVLRAPLEDRWVAARPAADRRDWGTKQRFDALLGNGEFGGTLLHPPFDRLARDAGCVRLAGHLELLPDVEPQVTIVPSGSIGTAAVMRISRASTARSRSCSRGRGGDRRRVAEPWTARTRSGRRRGRTAWPWGARGRAGSDGPRTRGVR